MVSDTDRFRLTVDLVSYTDVSHLTWNLQTKQRGRVAKAMGFNQNRLSGVHGVADGRIAAQFREQHM